MTNWSLDTLEGWKDYQRSMEAISPGYFSRWRPRILTYLYYVTRRGTTRLRYQFGYEIHGYGTVVGHCRNHKPHRTVAGAARCRDRFLSGEPDSWWNRMPWNKREWV